MGRAGAWPSLAVAVISLAFLGGIVPIAPEPEHTLPSFTPLPVDIAPARSLAFGADPGRVDYLAGNGIAPDMIQIWAGEWLERGGWDAIDRQLADARDRGITPVIQFYYWGDELDYACFQDGCTTAAGNRKDQAGWQRLAEGIVDHLHAQLEGSSVVVVLETEFNKDMRRSEDLDAALAEKARFLKEGYPAVRVALGFGNWDRSTWPTFDRAAAASDEMSLQSMRASTRHDVTRYVSAADELIAGAKELQRLFGKPIIVSDMAWSTYGGPQFLAAQRQIVERLFDRADELHETGVYALVYRSISDVPTMPTTGYFGQAERHFGLVWHNNGTAKPAFETWRDGVLLFSSNHRKGPRIQGRA